MTEMKMIELLGILVVSLLMYVAVSVWTHHYGRGWVTPDGTSNSNWKLRDVMGYPLGAIAVCVNSVLLVAFVEGWLFRVILGAQSIILATAGMSDIRRFHLPLPLTMAGMILAIVHLVLAKVPFMFVMLALFWVVAVIIIHAALSLGSMQLGDHLATIWIALAMPLNGMIAIIMGDFANVGVARMKSLRSQKVAAAGAWLIIAAAMAGLPAYYDLYNMFLKGV